MKIMPQIILFEGVFNICHLGLHWEALLKFRHAQKNAILSIRQRQIQDIQGKIYQNIRFI